MPNFSGVWNLKEQIQAVAAGRWTGLPAPELYAWGLNSVGQLGDDTVVSKSSPTQIGALSDWYQVSAWNGFSASLKVDGTLWTWGTNEFGNLGDGTTVSKSSPVQIGVLSNWYQVSAGSQFTAAAKTDGTIWTWGRDNAGQLGQNTNNVNKSSPVQVGALTNWSTIAAGSFHALAVKVDGTLWSWGYNVFGDTGTGTSTFALSSPVQVGALTNWSIITAGRSHSVSIKTDGTLWAWGRNTNGQLGDGTIVSRSSPVQVGLAADWQQVSAGSLFTCAVKADGTLWAWGQNSTGQLGDGTVVAKSSPIQVGALTNWSQVSSGYDATAATKTDGTLWTWGDNGTGELGDGTITDKSSPVQIGALTNWSQVSVGSSFALSIFQGSSN